MISLIVYSISCDKNSDSYLSALLFIWMIFLSEKQCITRSPWKISYTIQPKNRVFHPPTYMRRWLELLCGSEENIRRRSVCAPRTHFFFLYSLRTHTFAPVNTTHIRSDVKCSIFGFNRIIYYFTVYGWYTLFSDPVLHGAMPVFSRHSEPSALFAVTAALSYTFRRHCSSE